MNGSVDLKIDPNAVKNRKTSRWPKPGEPAFQLLWRVKSTTAENKIFNGARLGYIYGSGLAT
jgi:hypothetical protein